MHYFQDKVSFLDFLSSALASKIGNNLESERPNP